MDAKQEQQKGLKEIHLEHKIYIWTKILVNETRTVTHKDWEFHLKTKRTKKYFQFQSKSKKNFSEKFGLKFLSIFFLKSFLQNEYQSNYFILFLPKTPKYFRKLKILPESYTHHLPFKKKLTLPLLFTKMNSS